MHVKIETETFNGELIDTTQQMIQERLENFAGHYRRLKELHVSIDLNDPAKTAVEIEARIGEQIDVSKASAGSVLQAVDDAIKRLHVKLTQRLHERKEQVQEEVSRDERDDLILKIGGGVAAILVVGILGFAILRMLAGSSGGFNRASVAGNVMLDGKPVDQGIISLTPTSGTTGPIAYGLISDGQYSILAEQSGPVVGKQQVRITAHRETGKINDRGPIIEQYIPPTYNRETILEVDIDSGENTHNFELSSR